jgi:5-oxoprolinase (ATP-hydrolysing) subunit A
MSDSSPPSHSVDLNADVGESFGRWTLGDDDAVLEVVTSANVACGFHAGDPGTLRRTCELAAERGVAVGAQVAYRDLAGFGRRFMAVPPAELRDEVLYQLGALSAFAAVAGTAVTYLKPHGALYNAAVSDAGQAGAIAAAVAAFDPDLAVLGLPGSALLRAAADVGLRTVPEAFADRGYTQTGSLMPRSEPGAVVSDPAVAAARARRMVTDGEVIAADGTRVRVAPRSVCVHGDTPGAAAVARRVREELETAGVRVRAFAPPPSA